VEHLKQTTNYGIPKPESSDLFTIESLHQVLDSVDTIAKQAEDASSSVVQLNSQYVINESERATNEQERVTNETSRKTEFDSWREKVINGVKLKKTTATAVATAVGQTVFDVPDIIFDPALDVVDSVHKNSIHISENDYTITPAVTSGETVIAPVKITLNQTIAADVVIGTELEVVVYKNVAYAENETIPIERVISAEMRLDTVDSQLADIMTNVKNFGAKGDGTSDDTAAFQNAINYINTSGLRTFQIPKGRYKITQALHIPSSIRIVGDGKGVSILDFQGVSNSLAVGSSNIQTIGAGANFNNNTNTFTLSTGSLSIDDYVILAGTGSDLTYVTDTGGDYKKAVVKQIKAISGSTITTKSINQLPNITAFDIKSFNHITGVELSNLSIYTNYGTNGVPLSLIGLKDFKISNIEVLDLTGLGSRGISISYSVNGLVENCHVKGFSDSANSYAIGYGISINQCTYNIDVVNCDISNCKHTVALDGRDISQEKIRVFNSKLHDGVTTSFAMDNHTLAYDIEYFNNKIFNYYGGFICRGIKLRFINNDIDVNGKLCSIEQYAVDCICQGNKINAATVGYSEVAASIQFIDNIIDTLTNGFIIAANSNPIKISFRNNKIENIQRLVRLTRNDVDISASNVYLSFINNIIKFSNQLLSGSSSETKSILKELYLIGNVFKEVDVSNTTTFIEYYNTTAMDNFYSNSNRWETINSLISTNNRTWFPPLPRDIMSANLGKIGWDGTNNIYPNDYTVNGTEWMDSALNKTLRYNSGWLDESGIISRGTTAQRPATPPYTGFKYYDTSLSKVVTWNGTVWV
jgi:hypothetical protein